MPKNGSKSKRKEERARRKATTHSCGDNHKTVGSPPGGPKLDSEILRRREARRAEQQRQDDLVINAQEKRQAIKLERAAEADRTAKILADAKMAACSPTTLKLWDLVGPEYNRQVVFRKGGVYVQFEHDRPYQVFRTLFHPGEKRTEEDKDEDLDSDHQPSPPKSKSKKKASGMRSLCVDHDGVMMYDSEEGVETHRVSHSALLFHICDYYPPRWYMKKGDGMTRVEETWASLGISYDVMTKIPESEIKKYSWKSEKYDPVTKPDLTDPIECATSLMKCETQDLAFWTTLQYEFKTTTQAKQVVSTSTTTSSIKCGHMYNTSYNDDHGLLAADGQPPSMVTRVWNTTDEKETKDSQSLLVFIPYGVDHVPITQQMWLTAFQSYWKNTWEVIVLPSALLDIIAEYLLVLYWEEQHRQWQNAIANKRKK